MVAVLRLAEEGATVPFIARYRKELTGALDEVAIRAVIDGKESWDSILKRQTFIVQEIERQGKLTDELRAKLQATYDMTALEDLYLPYKVKRKTKAVIAREAGLEPLANWLWDCGHGLAAAAGETPDSRASAFIDAEKKVPDSDAALAGAVEIIIERLSENADLRSTTRTRYMDEGFVKTGKGELPSLPGHAPGLDGRRAGLAPGRLHAARAARVANQAARRRSRRSAGGRAAAHVRGRCLQ